MLLTFKDASNLVRKKKLRRHQKSKDQLLLKWRVTTLREEILPGRKFGGFGGFYPKPPN